MSESERVRALVEALAKLVAALPMKVHAAVERAAVWLSVYEDVHADQLAALLAMPPVERVTWEGASWLTTSAQIDGLYLKVSGPHVPLAPIAALDEQAVAAALDQASAAIAGASS